MKKKHTTKKLDKRKKTSINEASRRKINLLKKAAQKKKKAGILKQAERKIKKLKNALSLNKPFSNPILSPNSENSWESWQTFNPAAVCDDNRIHLIYRALGEDGVSRFGYASSKDGVIINERSEKPVFVVSKNPDKTKRDAHYQSLAYASGGSWEGCEDPRLTIIGDKVYMLYVAFDGSTLPCIALTSIKYKDFLKKKWKWAGVKIISPPGIIDKSGCVFPEKVGGKYVILHRIFPNILLDYVNTLDFQDGDYLKGRYSIKVRRGYWDSRKIGAGAPPIKTKRGWLLIYYGVDDEDASQYKIGAMLLDLKKPQKVLYRTDEPILEPIEWYENEGHKAGVAYPCGAVVKDKKLFVYYGGADTVVCVAHASLDKFLSTLMQSKTPKLKKPSRK